MVILKCVNNYSFFFQLFDKENYINTHASEYIFTTEGHVIPLLQAFRKKPWADVLMNNDDVDALVEQKPPQFTLSNLFGSGTSSSPQVVPNVIALNQSSTSVSDFLLQ